MPDRLQPTFGLVKMRRASLLLVLLMGGCSFFEPDRCADIPAGAISAPPGAVLNEWLGAQAERAEADDFVIYESEWLADSAELGPLAKRRIARVAERVAAGENRLVVSRSDNTSLDEERRFAAVRYLADQGITDGEYLVTLGYSQALPLSGREAPAVVGRMLSTEPLPSSSRRKSNSSPFGSGSIDNPLGAALGLGS